MVNEKMKTYAAREAKNNFGALLDEAQRQPIQITRNGRIVAGVVNKEEFEEVIANRRKKAQRKIRDALSVIAKESDTRPRPTRAELRNLLECDDDEIDALFDEEFFQPK